MVISQVIPDSVVGPLWSGLSAMGDGLDSREIYTWQRSANQTSFSTRKLNLAVAEKFTGLNSRMFQKMDGSSTKHF